MAKANHEKAQEESKSAEVVELKQHEISTVSDDLFAADAGQGMENATQESFAIPFLSVLQKGSPQCDEALGQAIEGAKAGMFFENVTNHMFDGKKGILFVPCSYRRVFIRWGAKDLGGGFKGELTPEAVAQMRAYKKLVEVDNKLYVPLDGGVIDPKKCDMVNDTRNHYGLLLDEATGGWASVLLSLASTQIKKSKQLMSMLASVKIQGANGMYTPPTFANVVHITSIGESNDKGAWFGVKFDLQGRVARREIYEAAKTFHATVIKGDVEVKYEAPAGADSADTSPSEPEKF